MSIARAGVPYLIEYPTFDQVTGLFLGAKIMDITAGLPGTIVGSVLSLTDTAGDGLYCALFTPVVSKRYRVIKQLYTDGTYTTIDAGRAPDIEFLDSCEILEVSDVVAITASSLEAQVIDNEEIAVEILDNEQIEAVVKDCN